MFQGIVRAALPAAAAAGFIAMTATSAPAFTLSGPALDKPGAASSVEKAYFVRYGWGWPHPWVYSWDGPGPWAYGYGWPRPRPYVWGWRHPWGYGSGWPHRWG